jgi:hypothetical protein
MSTYTSNYYQLPVTRQTQIQVELRPDESIVWAGNPNPRSFATSSDSLGTMIFGLLWTAFSATFMFAGLNDQYNIIFFLFGLGFTLIGGVMLGSPIWAYREAGKTAYVITDLRAIIFDGGGLRIGPGDEGVNVGLASAAVHSFDLERLTSLESESRTDGSGDLKFKLKMSRFSSADDPVLEGGFIAIPNVVAVEALLRGLMETAARQDATK